MAVVDREQVRRDADSFVGVPSWAMTTTETRLARYCLALLAELEQAEKAAEDAEHRRARFMAELDSLEARLAKVPALVEALRRIASDGDYGAAILAVEALAEWEQG